MGPTTLFDKSFLQSLSVNESVFFDRFFYPIVCPLFYVETLADLEKHVREGRTPEQEVAIIADKLPEMSGAPCAYHGDLGVASLLGFDIPMVGRIPTRGGRQVKLDGKSGIVHEVPPETEAFARWQNREFLYVERQFARVWREMLNRVDLEKIANGIRTMGITPGTCTSLQDARKTADIFLQRGGAVAVENINLALALLELPPAYDVDIFARWASEGRGSLLGFAPYAAHLITVEVFFQIALGANLIGTADANNRTDIGYLFYLPFCQVFVSSDNLHRRCAPHFLRGDQTFVWGPDLKADLKRLMNQYAARPQEEKERGLMYLAPTPPPDDHGSLVVQLWDRHLHPSWRKHATMTEPRDAQRDAEIVAHLNRLASAPPVPPDEVGLGPNEAEFVQLTRRVSQRKGDWWQLPKHLKG